MTTKDPKAVALEFLTTQYAAAVSADEAGTLDTFLLAIATVSLLDIETTTDIYAQLRAERAESDAFDVLVKDILEAKGVAKTWANKHILPLHEHIAEYSREATETETTNDKGEKVKTKTPAYTPTMTVILSLGTLKTNDKGEQEWDTLPSYSLVKSIAKSRSGKTRATTGDKSPNSRISAFVAYQRGVKAGDTFIIKQLGKGEGYQDETAGVHIKSRENGGLCGYFLRTYADSETAKVLAEYGNTLD